MKNTAVLVFDKKYRERHFRVLCGRLKSNMVIIGLVADPSSHNCVVNAAEKASQLVVISTGFCQALDKFPLVCFILVLDPTINAEHSTWLTPKGIIFAAGQSSCVANILDVHSSVIIVIVDNRSLIIVPKRHVVTAKTYYKRRVVTASVLVELGEIASTRPSWKSELEDINAIGKWRRSGCNIVESCCGENG